MGFIIHSAKAGFFAGLLAVSFSMTGCKPSVPGEVSKLESQQSGPERAELGVGEESAHSIPAAEDLTVENLLQEKEQAPGWAEHLHAISLMESAGRIEVTLWDSDVEARVRISNHSQAGENLVVLGYRYRSEDGSPVVRIGKGDSAWEFQITSLRGTQGYETIMESMEQVAAMEMPVFSDPIHFVDADNRQVSLAELLPASTVDAVVTKATHGGSENITITPATGHMSPFLRLPVTGEVRDANGNLGEANEGMLQAGARLLSHSEVLAAMGASNSDTDGNTQNTDNVDFPVFNGAADMLGPEAVFAEFRSPLDATALE
jgi:hypothetical protein